MYMLNEILLFAPERRQEALDRLTWIFSLFQKHSGFKRAIVARYLGDATRYAILRFWDRPEDWDAFRASPDGGYGRTKPPGIYENEHVLNPLVSFGEAAGSSKGNFLVEIERTVPGDAWDGFLKQQRTMLDVAPRIPGFVWANQLRAKDADQSLVLARFSDREAYERMVDSEAYQEALKSMPEGVSHVQTGCYEVLVDVGAS